MEEHLWTSSFWRLISNCSDSRKLLIIQKIILHKLGNKPEFSKWSKYNSAEALHLQDKVYKQKPNDESNSASMIKNEIPIKQSTLNIVKDNNIPEKRTIPIMGTNALLAKYNNCEESEDSKIIAGLVNERFNKRIREDTLSETSNEQSSYKFNLDLLNVSELMMDDVPLAFDEEKFLTDALGDDINSFISTEFECTYEGEEIPQQEDHSTSISSSRISSLISRATSVHAPYKKHTKRRIGLPSSIRKPQIEPSSNTGANVLLQEASIQHQIIIEACKALDVCLTSKGFFYGAEHIAAERILLLAMYKQRIILNEMKQLQHLKKSRSGRGYANISQLQFPLTAKTQKDGYINWFVAIVSCGTTSYASDAILADINNTVQFNEIFKFENLQHDFEIIVNIYSMLAKSNASSHAKSGNCPLNDDATTSCLRSPDKMFHRRNYNRRSQANYFEQRESSFRLWGKSTINISDLDRTSFPLEQISNSCILKGLALMNFNVKVEFDNDYSDFLTLRTECDNCMDWNLRWCNLVGHTLYYWNYPADQGSIEPIGNINLQHCVASQISIVDRNLCARPRTLLLETVEPTDQGAQFLRHFLSADSSEKLQFWKNCLNEMLCGLTKWNLMKCKVQLI